MNILPSSLQTLYQISANFVMLAGAGRAQCYHITSGDLMGKEGFTQFCTRHFGDVTLIAMVDGEQVTQSKSSGAVWWQWNDASKRTVRRIVMEPTSEPEDPHSEVFNLWHVLKHEMAPPAAGVTNEQLAPLIEHLMYISDGDAEGVGYFLNWLAWQYQFPETKIPVAIMLYSRRGRIGKSILGRLLAHVFGKSLVKSIDGLVLHKNFMDAMEHKRLVVLNELSRTDRQDSYERFKSFISEDSMEFEGKGRASKEIKNIAHYIITTNNSDALPLMDGDGRFLVLRCESERRPNEYYAALAEWIDGPGPELLAGAFNEWKFPKEFDPFAPAPQTAASRKTQMESRSGLHFFIQELIDQNRPPFDKDMGRVAALIEQLGTLYPTNIKGMRINQKSLPSVLADIGAEQMTTQWIGKNGKRICAPIWCWRNKDDWRDASGEARALHFDN